MPAYYYDDHNIRFNFVQYAGKSALNWVLLPGGPGADSRYLKSLIKAADLKGNVWLVDLPGNGDNKVPPYYDYSQWYKILGPSLKRFENCILVCHSFGGMLALLTPELEKHLQGFVLLHTSPSLWFEASQQAFSQNHVPELWENKIFEKKPSQENFKKALLASIPYFFRPEYQDKGRSLFQKLPFPYQASQIVLKSLTSMRYKASWIPQNVKTLIIGGSEDYIHPFHLFEEDIRFNRPNITKHCIQNAGHWSWIEKPSEIKQLFNDFTDHLTKEKGSFFSSFETECGEIESSLA